MVLLKHTFQIFFLCLSVFFLFGCEKSKQVDIGKMNMEGKELAYYVRGQGEPLVMIMGFRGTMGMWDPALLEILEQNYTLILFDNRGVGLSSNISTEALTIGQMAEDTAKLIESLGYKNVNVLGWSMGSRIALELSFKHPELVRSLILCSPNPGGEHQAIRTNDAYAKLTTPNISQTEILSLIFPETQEGKKASAEFVERLTVAVLSRAVPDDLTISTETIQNQVHALKLWNQDNGIYEKLLDIKIPTLVAGGLADVLDEPKNIQIIASRISFAWTAYFPGAGHNFLSQDYNHFAELVKVFIESN